MQVVSAALGAAVGKIVGGDAQVGASVAASETKNNWLTHAQQKELAKALKAAKSNEEILQILTAYKKLSEANISTFGEREEVIEKELQDVLNDLGLPLFSVDNTGLNNNLSRAQDRLITKLGVLSYGKGVAITFADEALGELYIDKLRTSYTIGTGSARTFGPATTVQIRVGTTPTSTIVLKNVRQWSGGVVAVGASFYEVWTDYETFGASKEFVMATGANAVEVVAVAKTGAAATNFLAGGIGRGNAIVIVALVGGGILYYINSEYIEPWKEEMKENQKNP
jgi:hypothetical protein